MAEYMRVSPLCVCVCVCVYRHFTASLSIHGLMDTGCFHILAIVSNATVNIYCCLFGR